MFLSLSFLGLSTNVLAEDEGEQKVRKALDEVFSELDKTKIPTGFLEEYAVDYISMEKYSDDNQGDTTLVDIDIMTYLMKGIRSAAVEEKPFGDVDEIIEKYKNDKPVAERTETYVLFNAYKYNYIPDSAVSEGKIQVVNNKVKDVYRNGSWVNPYGERQLIAFSPIEHTVPMGVDFTFKFPESKWWSNQTIRYTQVDFGDGKGVRGLTPTHSATAHYTTPGRKRLHMTVWFNGWTVGVNSYVDVIDIGTKVPTKGGTSEATYGDKDTTFTYLSPSFNREISATATVKYAPGHKSIQRPLIVVEGFDLTPFFSQYSGDIAKQYGATNLETYYSDSGTNFNYFKSKYDIIYVDWNDPEAPIKENARMLNSIIHWVNGKKTTTEKNVIIGQSMGGLIARYALYGMVRSSKYGHQTRMFVSYDSPNLGANVPVGMQSLIYLLYDYLIQKNMLTSAALRNNWINGAGDLYSYFYNLLYEDSSASEMMAQRIGKNGQIDNTYYKRYQTCLNSYGLPKSDDGTEFINIGFSNGKYNGDYSLIDNEYLFKMDGYLEPNFWGDLVGFLFSNYIWIAHPFDAVNNFRDRMILRLHGRDSRLSVSAYARANTSKGKKEFARISVNFNKKIIFGLINVSVCLYDSSVWAVSDNAYDAYYGSEYSLKGFLGEDGYDLVRDIYDISDMEHFVAGKYQVNMKLSSRFNFVPTASALGCKSVVGESYSPTLSVGDFQSYTYYNGTCRSEYIPFDYYMCSSSSHSHIGFDDDLYGLMRDCLEVSINGPEIPVTGDRYELHGVSGVSNLRWTSSKSWLTFASDGTVSIDADKADGVVEITATWSDGKNTFSKSRKVVAGIPEFSLSLSRTQANDGYQVKVVMNDPDFKKYTKSMTVHYFWLRKIGEGTTNSLGINSADYQIAPDSVIKDDSWYTVSIFLGAKHIYRSKSHTIKVPCYNKSTSLTSYTATLDSGGEIFLSSDDNQEHQEVEEKLMNSETFINNVDDFKKKDARLAIIPIELNIDGSEVTVPVKIVKSDVLKGVIK